VARDVEVAQVASHKSLIVAFCFDVTYSSMHFAWRLIVFLNFETFTNKVVFISIHGWRIDQGV